MNEVTVREDSKLDEDILCKSRKHQILFKKSIINEEIQEVTP